MNANRAAYVLARLRCRNAASGLILARALGKVRRSADCLTLLLPLFTPSPAILPVKPKFKMANETEKNSDYLAATDGRYFANKASQKISLIRPDKLTKDNAEILKQAENNLKQASHLLDILSKQL